MATTQDYTPRFEYQESLKRVRARLFLLRLFSQFPDCPISLYRDNKKALEYIKKDLESLRKIESLSDFSMDEVPMIDSDLLASEVTNYIQDDTWEIFYSLLFSNSDIKNEGFFIQELIGVYSQYNKDIEAEYPILRHWLYFLEGKQKLNMKPSLDVTTKKQSKDQPESNTKLTMRQIAFIYQYENKPLYQKDAEDILRSYGWKEIKKTSAGKLVSKYSALNNTTQRTSATLRTINDIKLILPLLTEKAKGQAEDELKTAINNQSKKN